MNKIEKVRYGANNGAKEFMKEFHDALSNILLYSIEKAAFDALMAKLDEAKQVAVKNLKVYSDQKKIYRLELAETMFKFGSRACVQADQLRNTQIIVALNKSFSFYFRGKESVVLTQAQSQRNLMFTNRTILTVLTLADFDEMDLAIKNYNDIIVMPKNERNFKKTEATELIPKLLNQIDRPRINIGKLVYSYLPAHAALWDERTKVGNPKGVRYLSLCIKITDSIVNVPLRRVKCTISDGVNSFVKYSSRRGYVRFKSLGNNNWTITTELENHAPDFRNNIATHQKKVTRINISLVKFVEPEPPQNS